MILNLILLLIGSQCREFKTGDVDDDVEPGIQCGLPDFVGAADEQHLCSWMPKGVPYECK